MLGDNNTKAGHLSCGRTYHTPPHNVRICGGTSAADLDLVASRLDYNGFVKRSCMETGVSSRITPNQAFELSSPPLRCDYAPVRSDGSGDMSKISIPCIFPRISRRSRPVACSRSVGIVPGSPPGGSRSFSVLISVMGYLSTARSQVDYCTSLSLRGIATSQLDVFVMSAHPQTAVIGPWTRRVWGPICLLINQTCQQHARYSSDVYGEVVRSSEDLS